MKTWLKWVLRILAVLLVAVIGYVLFQVVGIAIYMLVDTEDVVPREGVWYCEDLQLQFSFEKDQETYMIIDGEKHDCYCVDNSIRTELLDVVSKEKEKEFKNYHDTLAFRGTLYELKENSMIILQWKTEKPYTFVRVDD